jgi:hypothetical protein
MSGETESTALEGEIISMPTDGSEDSDTAAAAPDDEDKQTLVDESSPVDGSATEVAIKETTIADLEKSSAWAALKAQEYADIIAHRKKWSNTLLFLVSFIIVMDFVIVFLVGTNGLSYKSPLAIPAFIGSSVLEIFGLSYIVVQYLFPNSKPSTKDIDDDHKGKDA